MIQQIKKTIPTFTLLAFLVAVVLPASAFAKDLKPLVERLGFPADAKVLIINGDDYGMNHATNKSTASALKSGGRA